jgi:crotonobetainyl-CoA:carnitine CoA-transferase CaiB-like acyl-CoA transferase
MKQGLCINLKDPRVLELMHKLTDSADVFVENYRPGALELSARNAGLVYCSISAYGHTRPDSHRAGFGLIAEAKSGIMQMVGTPGEAPPTLRIALGDLYTGAHGVAAICAALHGRAKSGQGRAPGHRRAGGRFLEAVCQTCGRLRIFNRHSHSQRHWT